MTVKNSSCAIIQPYIFPYIGYYQIALLSKNFVFFDDVNYIKKGYINRNNIRLNGSPHRFTLPIKKASQNKKICDLQYIEKSSVLKIIKAAYRKSPHFDKVFDLISDVLESSDSVSEVNAQSIVKTFNYLGVDINYFYSSAIDYDKRDVNKKIISICRELGFTSYNNPFSGAGLYDPNEFAAEGIEINFFQPTLLEYDQGGNASFVPRLSIIDALMNCEAEVVKSLISIGAEKIDERG